MKNESGQQNDAYLEWLVVNRSRNQQASLKILQLGRKYRTHLLDSHEHTRAFDQLTATVFSLWRGVFLCDGVDTDIETFHRDADAFLENLVHNNAVAYPQDRLTRNWAFRYYAITAMYRLGQLTSNGNGNATILLESVNTDHVSEDALKTWEYLQSKLDQAVSRFDDILSAIRVIDA